MLVLKLEDGLAFPKLVAYFLFKIKTVDVKYTCIR